MFAELIAAGRAAEQKGIWEAALEKYEAALQVLPSRGTAQDAARLLRWIGTVHRERGELELADEVYETSLAIAEASDLTADVASVLNCLAITEQYRGRADEAEQLYKRAKQLATQISDDGLLAMIGQNLGTLASIRGDAGTALSSYRSALSCYRRLGEATAAAGALSNLGKVHLQLEDLSSAESCFRSAINEASLVGDAVTTSYVELNRATMFVTRQQFEDARESCDRAFASFSRMGSKSGLAEVYRLYGMLYRELGRTHLAEVHLIQALSLAQSTQDPLLEAETHTEWANLYAEMGQHRDALVSLNRAQHIFRRLRASRHILQVERMMNEVQPRFLGAISQYNNDVASASDPEINGHACRVAAFSCLLGDTIGFSQDQSIALRTGALLHDIGKAVVPKSVLTKQSPLNGEEWELVQSHTVVGNELISDLEFAWDISPIVRNHHEHWDGGGYPDRLEGEDIPIVARVTCVADVYDALTSQRSYRPAMTSSAAIAQMEGMSGSILDPDLFHTFRQLVDEGAVAAAANSASLLVAV